MAYVEQFSTDPASNNKAPPLGAPEGGLPFERISDTFRIVMAGEAELYEMIQKIQSNPAGSAENATKFGGRTRQQFYDDIWPVGSERAWNSLSGTGLTPSGITAIWTLVAKDCLLVGASNAGGAVYGTVGATTGSGTAPSVSSDGAHTHGSGSTGSTALTNSHLPANTYVTNVATDPTADVEELAAGSEVGLNLDTVTGGGAGHTHSIASGGAHTHTVTLPQRYAVAWFRRTA